MSVGWLVYVVVCDVCVICGLQSVLSHDGCKCCD